MSREERIAREEKKGQRTSKRTTERRPPGGLWAGGGGGRIRHRFNGRSMARDQGVTRGDKLKTQGWS